MVHQMQKTLIQTLLEMSDQDLRDAEYVIEWLFKDLKIDVVWSNHFKQRVTDREQNVTKAELVTMFQKLKAKYGDLLKQAQHNHEHFVAVLTDISTDLNVPFAIHFDNDTPKYKLHGITIMRKKGAQFHANVAGGHALAVENATLPLTSELILAQKQ
jgi:hypothetical protein